MKVLGEAQIKFIIGKLLTVSIFFMTESIVLHRLHFLISSFDSQFCFTTKRGTLLFRGSWVTIEDRLISGRALSGCRFHSCSQSGAAFHRD